MNSVRNILWGIVLIFLGLVVGINALGYAHINIFFDGWWTLFIIIPCFIDLFKEKDKTGNIIGLLIGLAFLLGCQNIIDFDIIWKLALPTILVIIGLSLIFKDLINDKIRSEVKKLNTNESNREYCATFSGQKLNFDKEKFEGAKFTAVFGGIECDLRNSIIKNDVVIDASSIFGGITLLVPEDVKVKVISSSIFGGVSNKNKSSNEDKQVTIYINANCIFGGVDVK